MRYTQINLLSACGSAEHFQRHIRSPVLPFHLGPRAPQERSVDLILRSERAVHRQGGTVDLTSLDNLAALPFDASVTVPKRQVVSVIP